MEQFLKSKTKSESDYNLSSKHLKSKVKSESEYVNLESEYVRSPKLVSKSSSKYESSIISPPKKNLKKKEKLAVISDKDESSDSVKKYKIRDPSRLNFYTVLKEMASVKTDSDSDSNSESDSDSELESDSSKRSNNSKINFSTESSEDYPKPKANK